MGAWVKSQLQKVGTVVPTQFYKNSSSMKKKIYVLIACEESQTECIAFRQMGAAAYSCDLQKCSGGHDEWHIRDDVEPYLKGRRYFKTEDGRIHHVPCWDLIIAHPPCTYITRAGAVNLYIGGQLDPVRDAYGIVAADFFRKCLNAKAPFVAVENPVPMKRYQLPPLTQIVQPWEHGAPWTKPICLWLKNLPPLLPTVFNPTQKSWVANTRKAKKRSKSFEGIARAMAMQWLDFIARAYKWEKHGYTRDWCR